MRILMSLPTEYKISWEINSWMHTRNQVNEELSWQQWYSVYDTFQSFGICVSLIKPGKNFADMVFTANAGFSLGNRFILSNFRYQERKVEEELFRYWFKNEGFKVFEMLKNIFFEGQGELLPISNHCFLFGYGLRSDLRAKEYLEKYLKTNREIIPLKLVDDYFYHLDTCIFYIDALDTIVYYRKAFDEESLKRIKKLKSKKLEVSKEEALNFSLNSFSYKDKIILTDNERLKDKASVIEEYAKSHRLEVIKIKMTEFLKS